MRYLMKETTYILSNFNTGDTVTIDIYRLSDNSLIVDTATCSEIDSTGRFSYLFGASIIKKTEYLYIVTNGTGEQQGKLVFGGYPDNVGLSTAEHNQLMVLDTESVDIAKVNGIEIKGVGSDVDPWNPV